MKKSLIILIIGLILIISVNWFNSSFNKLNTEGKDLILTALPEENNPYYKKFNMDLIDFNQSFENKLNKSDVLTVLTKRKLSQPTINLNYDDIWVRDVAPVVTTRLVKFKYAPEYLDINLSTKLDKKFSSWLDSNRFNYHSSPLILDGGNLVWDKKETVILTDRILSDNSHWSKEKIISQLKKDLQVKNVIIVPTEKGDILSHADGMVKFIGSNTLFISDFLGDNIFRKKIEKIIQQTLPNIEIITMTSSYVEEGQYDEKIASAKGLYINMLETKDAIYIPQFDLPSDKEQVNFVKGYTNKNIIPVSINDISTMGGAINCLTWYCPKEFLPTS